MQDRHQVFCRNVGQAFSLESSTNGKEEEALSYDALTVSCAASIQKLTRQATPGELKIGSDLLGMLSDCCAGIPTFHELSISSILIVVEIVEKETLAPFQNLAETLSCVSSAEFVEMVFSAANGISEKDKKATITPEHVLAAIEQLELSSFKEPVAAFLQSIKESKGKYQS